MTWWRYPLSLSTYISKTVRSPFFIIEFLISWIWQSLKNSVHGIQSHLKSASEGKKDLIISNQGLWRSFFFLWLKTTRFLNFARRVIQLDWLCRCVFCFVSWSLLNCEVGLEGLQWNELMIHDDMIKSKGIQFLGKSPNKSYCRLFSNNFCSFSDVERISFECWKVIGFSLIRYAIGLEEVAPLFHPIRGKNTVRSHVFSRAWRQPHLFSWSVDWSRECLCRDHFGFGFSLLDWKAFYCYTLSFAVSNEVQGWGRQTRSEDMWSGWEGESSAHCDGQSRLWDH